MASFKATIRTVGLDLVEQKLRMAPPHLIENNVAMVTAMLEYIKPIVIANTPLGPGHFGFHLRDRFKISVGVSSPLSVKGELKAPMQGYWREFGTKGRSRRRTHGKGAARARLAAFGGHGERAFMTAHKATAGVKKIINFYYGGIEKWWHA